MKTLKTFFVCVMALLFAVSAINAEAKRLGGGKSVGKQSSNVTQREAASAPAAPAAPAAPSVAPAQAAPKPVAPAPAAAPKRPWGAMLGGLAAGLGLAWLAHSLGLGAEFGQFLMFGLLALVIMVAVGWFMRRKPQPERSPFAFEGAGQAPSYRPENVGNDASVRRLKEEVGKLEVERVKLLLPSGGRRQRVAWAAAELATCTAVTVTWSQGRDTQ